MHKKKLITATLFFLVIIYFVFDFKHEKKPTLTTDWNSDRCMNNYCPGDVYPEYDKLKETPLKLGGAWFIGPRKYFSSASNALGFEWWEQKAVDPTKPRPPELQKLAEDGKSGDYAVRVFLSQRNPNPQKRNLILDYVELAKNENRVVDKILVKPNLERWEIKDNLTSTSTNFVYLPLKDNQLDTSYPILYCINVHPNINTCTTSFRWKNNFIADVRFRSQHAPEWIEIFEEITRDMKLLRQAP